MSRKSLEVSGSAVSTLKSTRSNSARKASTSLIHCLNWWASISMYRRCRQSQLFHSTPNPLLLFHVQALLVRSKVVEGLPVLRSIAGMDDDSDPAAPIHAASQLQPWEHILRHVQLCVCIYIYIYMCMCVCVSGQGACGNVRYEDGYVCECVPHPYAYN